MTDTTRLQNILTQIHFGPFRNLIGLPTTLIALLLAVVVRLSYASPGDTAKPATKWVGTWGTAEQLVEPNNMPPEPGLANNTLRQVVCVSIGGDRLRVHFSNLFGTTPVTLESVHIALSKGESSIDPATDRILSFDGRPEVTMAAGAVATSDSLEFPIKPRSLVAITICFGPTSAAVTGHPGSRTTSYLLAGNQIASVDFAGAAKTDHWYIISGIDVIAPENAAAVVVLGNSITDGRGSGTNKQNRWPDELAIRLQTNAATQQVSVLNMGIGGNCVLRNCLGPAAVDRFDRDVLSQEGVRWLIILEGINDIGQTRTEEQGRAVAAKLIDAYKQMIDRAHAKQIRVYGATLLPMGGSFYAGGYRDSAWGQVNQWIRTSGQFDAVIDIDAALRDRENPSRLMPDADSGDHLHPSERGHQMMGDAVDLNLFKEGWKKPE